MTEDVKRVLVATVLMVLLIVLTLFLWREWGQARKSAAEAALATSQANAAIASGADAADTIGNRMDADAITDQITRQNDEAIHDAAGANVPVGAAGDAGLAGLCQRAAYRGDSRCMQQPAAR